MAKLATSERPANFKVVNRPLGAVKVLIAPIVKVAWLFVCEGLS